MDNLEFESEEFRNIIIFLRNYYAIIEKKGPKRKYRTSIDNNLNYIVEKVLYSSSNPKDTLRKIGLIFLPNCVAINIHSLSSILSVSKSWLNKELTKEEWAKEAPNSMERRELNSIIGKFEAHKFTIRYPPERTLMNSISLTHQELLLQHPSQEVEYPSSPICATNL